MRTTSIALLLVAGWLGSGVGLLAEETKGLAEDAGKSEEAMEDDILGPTDKKFQELAVLAQAGRPGPRGEAIWKLARLADDRSVPPIVNLVDKAEPELRPYVAMGLGWLGPRARASAPALTRWLEDPSEFAQGTSVWALGRISGKQSRESIARLLKSENELLRFLAEEALARLDGREILGTTPLHRPLHGASILVYGERDAASMARVFAGPLSALSPRIDAVTVWPFNPAMGKLGGLGAEQEQRLSDRLTFQDGRPKVDLVFIAPVFAHELPPKARWELWNYVRRGGKLVTTDTPFRLYNETRQTVSQALIRTRYEWFQSLFDSLLPETIGPSDLPFLDGVTEESRRFRYGVRETGRGTVVVMGRRGPETTRIAELHRAEHRTWRHLCFWEFIGQDQAKDPLLWFRLFTWVLEGPEAFAASVSFEGNTPFLAGGTTQLPLRVRNYSLPDPALRLGVALVSPDEKELTSQSRNLRVDRGRREDCTIPFPIPFEACEEECRIRTTLVADGGRRICELNTPVKVVPCFSVRMTAPAEFRGPGDALTASVRLEKRSAQDLKPLSLSCAVADRFLRPLLRHEVALNADNAAPEHPFPFTLPDLPAGGYWWLAEVRHEGRLLGRKTEPLVRMEPWQFRKDLVVAPFGFGPPQPRDEVEALRSMGMTTYGLPPSLGMWTYLIENPDFIPRPGWPAEILEGQEGDEWRQTGEKFRLHPYQTFFDTVEEQDLRIGSNLLSIGDVEDAGHEQYRIYLKRKYRSLSALNEAWKSDYADWSEILLMGATRTNRDDVVFTSRIGGNSGDLVPVPEKLDPEHGVLSLQPYLDQNAWRWYYVWLLLEMRHAAFHQVNPYQAITPGGAMGLSGPFDYPHFRIYGWDPLTHFSLRATFGRPTYGTKPHIALVGVPGDEPALKKTCWQAIAAGARWLMPYAPGDYLGARILTGDYAPTPTGHAFGQFIQSIKSKQEVLLATRNAVHPEVLFLSEGDSGYGSALSIELYDALLHSGILPDYGALLAGRRIVVTGARELSPATVNALRKFVLQGGALLLLPLSPSQLIREFGLESKEEGLPADFAAKVTGSDSDAALKGVTFTSRSRRSVQVKKGDWVTRATYGEKGGPALMSSKMGKGMVFFANLVFRYGDDLEDRYRPGGQGRMEAEAFRRVVTAILDEAGVKGAHQTVDADGSVIPYVALEPIATEDGSQRYVIALADHRLPKGIDVAQGRIRLAQPDVKWVYDVYAERRLSLQDGQFPFELKPGDGTVYSLITEDPAAIEVIPEASEFGPGAPLRLALRVKRPDGDLSECEHAFHLHVYDPSGKEIGPLHQRVSIKGKGIVGLFSSWSDPDGEWRVLAHDLTTGAKGETRVRKQNTASAPPLNPGREFQSPVPDITLRVNPLPELAAFANFVELKASVSSTLRNSIGLRVRLGIPRVCILSGEPEQVIQLHPESPSSDVAWTLFISREDAVGFYYSDRPPGFLTDWLHPAIYRYRGSPTPVIELATTRSEPVRFQAAQSPMTAQVQRFAHRVPVRLNPFEWAPVRLSKFDAGKVSVSILNATGSPMAGKVILRPCEPWTPVPAELDFSVDAGKTVTAEVSPRLRDDAPIDPGLFPVPVQIRTGGRDLAAGELTIEHVHPRRWLVRKGSEMDADRESPNLEGLGTVAGASDWKPAVMDARIRLDDLLPSVGALAYAMTHIKSPEERPVRVKLSAIGARVRVWLNGTLAGGETKAAEDTDQTGDEFLREVGLDLEKGTNTLLVELYRTHKRYRGCTIALLDKEGRAIRDLRWEARADKERKGQ